MSFRQRRVLLDEEDLDIDPIYGNEVQELDYQRLYVTNIPDQLTDDGVFNYFDACGKVKSVYVQRDYSKTFGLVEFFSAADAQRACMALNNAPPLNLRMRFSNKKKQNFSPGPSSGPNTLQWNHDDDNAMMAARRQITRPSARNGSAPVRGRARQYFPQSENDDDFYDDEDMSMASGDVDDVDEELAKATSYLQQLLKKKKSINTSRIVTSKNKFPDAVKMKVVIQQKPAEPGESVAEYWQQPVQYERSIKCADNLTVQYRSPKFGLSELQNAIEECAKENIAAPDSPPEMLRSLCLVCDAEASTVCGGCRTAPYCSPHCQRSDWTARHAKLCHNLAHNVQHMQTIASRPSIRNRSESLESEEKKATSNVSRQRYDNNVDSGSPANVLRRPGQNNYQKRDNRTDGALQDNCRQYGNDSFGDRSTDDGNRRGYASKGGNRSLNPTLVPPRAPNHSNFQNRQRRDENSYDKKDSTFKDESWEKPEGNTASQTPVPEVPISVRKPELPAEEIPLRKPEKSIARVQTPVMEPQAAVARPSPAVETAGAPADAAVVKSADVEQFLVRPAVVSDSLVILTSVESPTRLFVRRADPESASAYESTLHSVAVHGLSAPAQCVSPTKGDIVLAEFGDEEGVFYRAAVMRTNVQANKYKIEYLEYGNEDKSSLEKMRKIGSEFGPKNLPVLVSRVVLAGFQDEKFNERAMDYLTRLKDGETKLVLTIPDGSKSAVSGSEVNLMIESTKKCLMSEIARVSLPAWADVAEKGLDAVLALPPLLLDAVQYVPVPQSACTLQVLDTLTLPDGTFSCFHADSDIAKKVLLEMEEELFKYAEETTLGKDPYLPRILELCIAKYEDGVWYRAVCLKSEAGCPEVTVMFLDYGNLGTVPVTDLRKMLPDFMEGRPAVASLASIQGFPEKPSDELIAAIRNVLEGDGGKLQCESAVPMDGGECSVLIPGITAIIESMK